VSVNKKRRKSKTNFPQKRKKYLNKGQSAKGRLTEKEGVN
jgi:hypothetical protein